MATTIGRVEFEVGADGAVLVRELRRVGRRAGVAGGKESAKAFKEGFDGESGLTTLGDAALKRLIRKSSDAGGRAGILTSMTFGNELESRLVRRVELAVKEMGEAFESNDGLDKWTSKFDRASDAIARMRENITLVSEGTRTHHTQIKAASDALDRYVERMRASDEELRRRDETLKKVERQERVYGNRLGNAISRGMDRMLRSLFKGNRDMEGGFNSQGRILKSHVARTIAAWSMLVLAIGEGTATLGSGLGSSLTAIFSSLAVAIVGMAGMAGAAIVGLVAQIGLAVNSLRFMKEEFPAFEEALTNLSDVAEKQGRRFAQAWGPSLTEFMNTLASVLDSDAITDAMASSLSSITQAFTDVLNSPSFGLLQEALATTIPNALTKLGSGFAQVFGGLSAVFAAASPALETFAGQFSTWATEWNNTMTAAAQDGSLQEFFNRALDSLNAVWGTVSSLSGALWTLFKTGADTGDRLLGTLTDLFNRWNEWMQSVEGQNALEEWFANGERIFGALLDLLGDLGQTLGGLVTAESVDRLVAFLDGLGEFLPIAGQILQFFGKLDILNAFVGLLNAIGAVLTPMMPSLMQLADVVGKALVEGFETLGPALEKVGTALAPVVEMLGESLAEILPLVFEALVPILEAFADLVVTLQPFIDLILVIVTAALPPLILIITEVAEYLAEFAAAFLDTGKSGDDFAKGVEIIGNIVQFVFESIANVISVSLEIASGIMRTVGALLRGDFSGAFSAMAGTVFAVFEHIQRAFESFSGWARDMYQAALDFVAPIASVFTEVGRNIGNAISGIIGWIKDAVNWFGSLFGAANQSISAGGRANGRGGLPAFASGGILSGPRKILAGEAGPEAIVPLRRPLSMVDPSVRALSALAQGLPHMASGGVVGGSRDINIAAGAIVVEDRSGNPEETSLRVLERIVEDVASR